MAPWILLALLGPGAAPSTAAADAEVRLHVRRYGYLDRRGEVTHRFEGGPYEGCFHVPRALWLCGRLLRTLEAGP